MADVDPVGVFFTVMKFAVVIIAIVLVFLVYGIFTKEIKTNDLDRYAIEAAESLMTSPLLTERRYVFNETKLDSVNNKFIYVANGCEFGYIATVEDMESGKEWNFANYRESTLYTSRALRILAKPVLDNNIIEYRYRSFNTAIHMQDDRKPNEFYSTARQAKLYIDVFDSMFLRVTCNVERSFREKKTLNITLKGCLTSKEDYNVCFSLKRVDPYRACYTIMSEGREKEAECRYMLSDVKFQDTYLARDGNKKVITTYPLKTSSGDCNTVKSSGDIASEGDNVETVLICLEAGA